MAKYDNIPGCPGYYISKRGQIYSKYLTGTMLVNWERYGEKGE